MFFVFFCYPQCGLRPPERPSVPMRFGVHLHGQGRAAATTTAGAHLRRQGRAVATTTAQLMMLVASVVGTEDASPKILLRNEQGMECSVELTAEGHLLSSCPIAAPSLNVSALEERLARIESALDSHNRLEGFVPPPSPPMPPGPPLPPSPPSTPSTPTTLRWNARSDWSVSNGGLTGARRCRRAGPHLARGREALRSGRSGTSLIRATLPI